MPQRTSNTSGASQFLHSRPSILPNKDGRNFNKEQSTSRRINDSTAMGRGSGFIRQNGNNVGTLERKNTNYFFSISQ